MADPRPLFTKIAAGMPTSISQLGADAARKWFREAAEKLRGINIHKLFEQSDSMVRDINITSIGSLYTYVYDPKTKERLPYYDVHPLVFIVSMCPGGWTGLNLHYLPPYMRAKLMDALYEISLAEKDMKKIQLSYNVLNSAAKFRFFKPCFKRYLADHVRSKFMFIKPDQWDIALQLPTQRFVKQGEDVVWRDSARMV